MKIVSRFLIKQGWCGRVDVIGWKILSEEEDCDRIDGRVYFASVKYVFAFVFPLAVGCYYDGYRYLDFRSLIRIPRVNAMWIRPVVDAGGIKEWGMGFKAEWVELGERMLLLNEDTLNVLIEHGADIGLLDGRVLRRVIGFRDGDRGIDKMLGDKGRKYNGNERVGMKGMLRDSELIYGG